MTGVVATLKGGIVPLDPVTGALKIQPQDVAGSSCGQAGNLPSSSTSTSTTTTTLVPLPGLPTDAVGSLVGAATGAASGPVGLPSIPGVSQ